MKNEIEFVGFPKIARLRRQCIITEKIDGTNAQIYITEDGQFFTGSRNRWVTPENDNYGFSKWAHENKEELMQLGPGRHFGEWWGQGINRGYGLNHRRFSLFNTLRWCQHDEIPRVIPCGDPRIVKYQAHAPACCFVVPVLYNGDFSVSYAATVLDILKNRGSNAVPGFMRPEGIVIFHVAGNVAFKQTIENDDQPKTKN